jgi:hypothetical protein
MRPGKGEFMRSDLVFGALSHVKNRYQLCQLASRATRKLHKPNTRVQETMNDVLVRFEQANPTNGATVSSIAQVPVREMPQRRAA